MFQFRVAPDREDLMALNRVAAKAYKRWRTLLLRLVLILCGLFVAVTGTLMFWLDAGILQGVLFLTIGLLYFFLGVFYYRLSARRSKKLMVEGGGEGEITLEEEGFRERDAKGEHYLPYTAVYSVYHYQTRYFIFLDKKHAAILPEDKLVEGDLSALPAFLEEKTGKTIVEL